MEMRAAVIEKFGGPEVVHIIKLPVPDLGENEILIEVQVAGVGSWDPDLVSGSFKDIRTHFPKVIGSDGGGTVRAIGKRVRRFKIGDRVYAWGIGNPKGGFFAEYAVVPQSDAAKIPPNISFEEASVLAIDGLTAMEGLDQAGLKPGQVTMIFGASGGVGHLAVQLAKIAGANVFAIASGDDGVDLVRRLGADQAADGHDESLLNLLALYKPNRGYDCALAFAGGKDGWKEELQLVKKRGRVAFPNGVEPEPQPPPGVVARPYDAVKSPAAFNRLNRLIARGHFHVMISHEYPLEDVPQALIDVQMHHLGKLAVRVKA